MTPEIQSILALLVVALAATWLVWRAISKRKSGCANDCGCPSTELKAKIRRQ